MAMCRERYAMRQNGGEVEQDPETLWLATRQCMANLAGQQDYGHRIAAVSLSAQISWSTAKTVR